MAAKRQNGYSVGYAKPPVASQFKKGRSGNPKGRPRGSKNLATILMQALAERVVVTEPNGRRRKISKLEVMTKQLANKAATADLPAMKLLFGMLQLLEEPTKRAEATSAEIGEEDREIIQELMARLQGDQGGDHD